MNTAPTAAIVAVLLSAKRRRLLRRFREVGAIDIDHAATLQALGVSLSGSFNRLVRRKVFVAVPDGRYYLDEGAASRHMRRKRIVGLVIVGIVLLASLIFWFSESIRR